MDFEEVASWAVRCRRWQAKPRKAIKECARELAKTAQAAYFDDETGQPVRRYHAAPFKRDTPDGPKQYYLWEPIDRASPTHFRRAIQCRRNGMVSDAIQVSRDVRWYNRNNSFGAEIQLDLNFHPDVDEAMMPDRYSEEPSD
jgi:hypothetical protein